jgi:hypothetical protein
LMPDAIKTIGHVNKRDGVKGFKDFNDCPFAQFGSKSNARKAASAAIAKIPLPLARWIARVFKPQGRDGEEKGKQSS